MNAATDFEKHFLKLMINSVYGKIISRNRAEDFLKYTSEPISE